MKGWVSATAMVILAVGVGSAGATIIGPDTYGYRATDQVPYAFVDITTTGTRTLAGQDDAIASAPIGFSFNFYGRNFTQASFTPNGMMTFGGATNQWANVDLATGQIRNNIAALCVMHDDWQFFQAGADGAYYETVGPAGSQQFILQWNINYAHYMSPSSVTFQAVLFEGSNNILLQYADVDSGFDLRYSTIDHRYGASATVGLKDDPARGPGRYLQWSYNSPVLSDGEAILFTTEPLPQPHPIPEPGSLLVWAVLAGLGCAVGWYRRRK